MINLNCRISCRFNQIVLRQLTSAGSTKVGLSADKTDVDDSLEVLASENRDVFGTLSTSGKRSLIVQLASRTLPEDADGYDKLEFDLEPRKNHYYYKSEIAKHALQGPPGLRKALELFQQMKAKDKVEPTLDNFSPLIVGCAKAGYTKRAFDLYEESLRYIDAPTKSNVTSLIDACAECPFPAYGLERLKWFLNHIKVSYNYTLNEIQYNCAIKAYGKLGHLNEASKLVQEMLDNNVIPTISTFNMLLIGCASNKEAGCTIALRVYKRLKLYQYEPTPVTYQLLLRCIRDCGMGSPELVRQTLKDLPATTSLDQRIKYSEKTKKKDPRRRDTSGFEWLPLLDDLGKSIQTAIKRSSKVTSGSRPNNLMRQDQEQAAKQTSHMLSENTNLGPASGEIFPATEYVPEALPNLLSKDHLDLTMRIKDIHFDKLLRGSDRLMLFGGLHGFLETMMQDGCKPNNKIFTLILRCLERTEEDYLAYHQLAIDLKIRRDILYYNTVIEDVCEVGQVRDKLELALHFVEQMQLDNLRPDINTYESLASGCYCWRPAKQLMDDIEAAGFVVSHTLITKLIKQAIKRTDFFYLCNLLDICTKNNFKPWKRHVELLEDLMLRGNELMLKIERGQLKDEKLIRRMQGFEKFRSKLNSWLKNVTLRVDHHPWEQFKVDTSSKRDGFTAYKRHFQAMERVKRESLKQGAVFGNISHKAERLSPLLVNPRLQRATFKHKSLDRDHHQNSGF